jgi:hypothetical protein
VLVFSSAPTGYRIAIIALLIAVVATTIYLPIFLSPTVLAPLIAENGIIERLTVVAYLVCIVVVLAGATRRPLRESLILSAPLALFAMRELDFQSRFTTMGMLKTKFYVSPDVPLLEKLVVIVCLVAIIWGAVQLVKLYARRFFDAALAFHPGAICIGLAVLLFAVSTTVDGIGRKAMGFGIEVDQYTIAFFQTLEEVSELGAPLFLILAAVTRFSSKLNSHGTNRIR